MIFIAQLFIYILSSSLDVKTQDYRIVIKWLIINNNWLLYGVWHILGAKNTLHYKYRVGIIITTVPDQVKRIRWENELKALSTVWWIENSKY